ncbi:MAG: hypothetical protein ACRD7E_03485, partial [Bryobacteraceae bacterium]
GAIAQGASLLRGEPLILTTSQEESLRCPVCQARFRGVLICSRCGGDLEPLMLLAADAYRLREAARMALNSGDFGAAHTLAEEAQARCFTRTGEDLRLLSRLLV